SSAAAGASVAADAAVTSGADASAASGASGVGLAGSSPEGRSGEESMRVFLGPGRWYRLARGSRFGEGMHSLEQMLGAVVADSRRRTYSLFGRFQCGF